MKDNKKSLKNKTVETMVISAIIIAIIAVMTFVPQVGYIAIPAVQISITTIPIVVILFAWLFGWKEALVAGFAFGLFSMIKAFVHPQAVSDVYFQNPMVSVLPRVLFGFIAGIGFDLLRLVKKPGLRFVLDIVLVPICVISHTVATLVMLFTFNNTDQFRQIITLILSINGLLEVGSATILVPLIILPLDKAFPRYEAIYHGTLSKRRKASIYDTITLNTHEDLMRNLATFVSINSVYDESTVSKTNPFGKGVSDALGFIEDLAKKDGFEVKNYNNKVVEILVGEGKNITIMAHADVVPAGSGWSHDPFTMIESDGKLFGRGVADDKGPLLAAYYAMKAVRDNHMMGDYSIRFLVGGNEESGSAGIEYYFKTLKKPQPNLGFSPDAEYPLIFAEKGIINFEVKKKLTVKHVHSIVGGVAVNSVIEKCVVTVDYDPDFITFLADHKYDADYVREDDLLVVTFNGKAAHGASPEEGFNAGMAAIKAVANFYTNKDLLNIYALYSNLQGYGLEAFATSDEMGHNTLNVGLIKYVDKQFSMTVNFRYVDKCDKKETMFNIKEMSKPFTVSVLSESPLLFYPKESVLVTTLLHAYQEETGDMQSQPKAIGGGTYAKEADNIVAFGMEFPGWNSNMHSPGEQVRKADLFKSVSIYARAIVELGKELEKHED